MYGNFVKYGKLFLFLEVIRMLEKDGKVHFDRNDYESMLKRDLQ